MPDLQDQLVKYLTDLHALEQNVSRQLDGMIETTSDRELKGYFEHHKIETERHKESLSQRLAAHGASPSVVKEAGQLFAAMGSAVVDAARSDNEGKNARDAFMIEHLEIASYELLEQVANFAGDAATVDLARLHRSEEQEMAAKIATRWTVVAMESLRQEGVDVDAEIAARLPGGAPTGA